MHLTSRIEKCIIVTLIVMSGTIGVLFIEGHYRQRQSQLETITLSAAHKIASQVQTQLSATLQKKVLSATTLANVIGSQYDINNEKLTTLSKNILANDSQILALGVARLNQLDFIYPEDTHPGLSAFMASLDIINQYQQASDSSQNDALHQIDEKHRLYVIRNPILDNTQPQLPHLGYVVVLSNIDKLLEDSFFSDPEFYIALRHKHINHKSLGAPEAFEAPLLIEDIPLYGANWQMYVAPRPDDNKPYWHLSNPTRAVGYPMLLVLMLLFSAVSLLYLRAKQRSMQDELTQLPNRRYFTYTLTNLIERTQQSGNQFAVLNLDLDGFKKINDQYGHAIGDKMLQEVAKRLRDTVRANDVVARVGGDEFLVIVSRLKHQDEAEQVSQLIQSKIEQGTFNYHNLRLPLRVSVGASVFQQGMSLDQLLSDADMNMYKNKALRRGSNSKTPLELPPYKPQPF